MKKLPNTPEKPIANALDAICQPEVVDYLPLARKAASIEWRRLDIGDGLIFAIYELM